MSTRELEALKSRVKKLDGKTVMCVHKVSYVASASMIVSDAEVDQIVTQVIYMKLRAFYKKFFGGKTAPDKLKFVIGSLNCTIAKRQSQSKRLVLKSRKDFLEFY